MTRPRGLRIPDDLSVVGFDDIPLSAWPTYDLTTVHQDVDEIIATAVELLKTTCRRPEPECKSLFALNSHCAEIDHGAALAKPVEVG